MNFRAIFFVCILLLAAPLAAPAAAQTWERTTGPNGSVSFEMPGKPAHSTVAMQSNKEPYEMHQYRVAIPAATFIVQTAVYPASTNVSQPKLNLQNSINNSAKDNDGGKWKSVTWTTFNGVDAVDAVAMRNGFEMRNFTLIKGSQIVSLTFAGRPGSATSRDAERFIKSLTMP